MSLRSISKIKNPYQVRCYYCLELLRATSGGNCRRFVHRKKVRNLDAPRYSDRDCVYAEVLWIAAKDTVRYNKKTRYSYNMDLAKVHRKIQKDIKPHLRDVALAYYNR